MTQLIMQHGPLVSTDKWLWQRNRQMLGYNACPRPSPRIHFVSEAKYSLANPRVN